MKKFQIIKFLSILFIILIISYTSSFAQSFNSDYLNKASEMFKDKYNGTITDSQLIQGSLKGMASTMDKYTEYYTPEEAKVLLSSLNGKYSGIGISLEDVNGYIVVQQVLPASPAELSGLRSGDIIVSVDGISTSGLTVDKVSIRIKGDKGSKVKIGLRRNNIPDIITKDITRDDVIVNPVTYSIRGDIGYIKLSIFNSNSEECLNKAFFAFDESNISKIILDLRDNPGGEVGQAVSLASRFIKGVIVKLDFKSNSLQDQVLNSTLVKSKYTKLAVLVNKNSASSSEIVAAAIQDTKVGVLIGTKTYGKGVVQNIFPILTSDAYDKYHALYNINGISADELLKKGIIPKDTDLEGYAKITTGEYITPAGRNIDKVGLIPDFVVSDYPLINGVDVRSIDRLQKVTKPILNSESIDVYNAENILKLAGYDVGVPDLLLDQKTVSAMMKFQKDYWLKGQSPVLDFSTQQALNEKLDSLTLEIDGQYKKALDLLK